MQNPGYYYFCNNNRGRLYVSPRSAKVGVAAYVLDDDQKGAAEFRVATEGTYIPPSTFVLKVDGEVETLAWHWDGKNLVPVPTDEAPEPVRLAIEESLAKIKAKFERERKAAEKKAAEEKRAAEAKGPPAEAAQPIEADQTPSGLVKHKRVRKKAAAKDVTTTEKPKRVRKKATSKTDAPTDEPKPKPKRVRRKNDLDQEIVF